MLLLIGGLILFVLLVVVHEFGHYLAARRGGVTVEEFGVGFPPKIVGRRFKGYDTEYTINALPLGGFVRLKGEHDADTGKGSFGAAKLSTKVKILLAGVGMNLATAWLFFLLLAIIGMPQLPLPNGQKQFAVANDYHPISSSVYISFVEENSPAEMAGIEVRDVITDVYPGGYCFACMGAENPEQQAGHQITNDDDLFTTLESHAGQAVKIGILREGQPLIVDATLRNRQEVEDSRDTDEPKGYFGVSPFTYEVARSTWSAPVVATGLTIQFTKLTLQGLGSAIANLFTGHAKEASQNVSGPIGIFFVLKEGSTLGFRYIFLIIALLSLTLAIMNVLPIPALDGGRLFVMLLFRAIKKPLTPRLEEKINATGFMALIGLIILITIVDVGRFF